MLLSPVLGISGIAGTEELEPSPPEFAPVDLDAKV